ncbi:MAG: amidohydrolase [Hyphomicrobiales bacterium]|nr:MAG: amidohydrolase [Hyphomicrobiales bacterium]
MTILKAACVQLCASRSVDGNIAEAEALIREAAAGGATYVLTPEQTALMELDREVLFASITRQDDDAGLARFRALAEELGIWLHIGSLAVLVEPERAANRSFLIAPDGTIAARYDKIHMFDVDLPGGERYRESKTYRAGTDAVVAPMGDIKVGMSICYDLRFPHLYRALAKAGASLLTVPAAFTKQTGEAHWHILLRARAIENGCFVMAAAQGGHHENGRDTFGHSLIIDPWGVVLAEAGTDPCVIHADLDLDAIAATRGRVPSLSNDRPFEIGDTIASE